MTQYDVIENNGGVAPTRREAIIDPMVGANHDNNKPKHGKPFGREQDRHRSDARAEQYLSRSLCSGKCIA